MKISFFRGLEEQVNINYYFQIKFATIFLHTLSRNYISFKFTWSVVFSHWKKLHFKSTLELEYF